MALFCGLLGALVINLWAHLYAGLFEDPTLEIPLVVLLGSRGHTMLIEMRGHGQYKLLGRTIDDAAGEAFDKVARFLGLGYPGDPAIDAIARTGDLQAISFPRAMLHDDFDFSFSGLKTSVINFVRNNPATSTADVVACFQEAVVDVLVNKSRKTADLIGETGLVLGGGVAANSLLWERFMEMCESDGCRRLVPSWAMGTDDVAMIDSVAWYRLRSDGSTTLDSGTFSNLHFSLVYPSSFNATMLDPGTRSQGLSDLLRKPLCLNRQSRCES
jgi:N6-L-threonylcarbamoyladenine synthase